MQEDHDLADDLLLGPSIGDAFGTHPTDARDFAQTIGLGLDDVEHLLAECLDHLLGVDRTNAADHAGTEILLDAIDRSRRRRAHEARLELLTMGAVINPFARRRDPLTGGDGGSMSDDGYQIAMAARFDPQNAEAVLAVVVSNSFDQPCQNFLG